MAQKGIRKGCKLLLKALDYKSNLHWSLKIEVCIHNCLIYNLNYYAKNKLLSTENLTPEQILQHFPQNNTSSINKLVLKITCCILRVSIIPSNPTLLTCQK